MKNVCKSIEEYNPGKKRNILIVQGKKQVEALHLLDSSDQHTIKMYNFQKCKTMQSLEVGILNRIIKRHDVVDDQVNLKYAIDNFKRKKKNEKELTLKNAKKLLTGWWWKVEYFWRKI